MSTYANYPQSFYKFDPYTDKCIPDYSYCLPNINKTNKMAVEYTPSTGFFPFILPMPCDYPFGSFNPIYDDIISDALINYAGMPKFQTMFLDNVTSTDIWHTKAAPSTISDLWTELGIASTGYTYSVGMCYCLYLIESDNYAAGTFNVLGKSNCLKLVAGTDCSIININYKNSSDSLGLPYIANPFRYEVQLRGKLWKPTIKTEGKGYLKSNNEWVVVSSRSDEIWILNVDVLNYYDIRNLTMALRSDTCNIQSLDFYQFNQGGTGFEQFASQEDPVITYLQGCFATGRATYNLLRKEPIGLVNYQC